MEELRPRISLRILDTLTNALYENPISVFREYVQNSMDGPNGENIKKGRKINVDISIDRGSREISIIDDGPGMDRKSFTDQMGNFSSNKFGSGSVGFRGIGRISAMPFCDKLIFETRPKSGGEVSRCEFDGSKYNEMLENSPDADLGEALSKLLRFENDGFTPFVNDREHYFAVFVKGYDSVLGNTVGEDTIEINGDISKFENGLCSLLPVDYSSEFRQSKEIKEKYESIFGHPFDKYVCNVFLDGVQLFKRYKDELVGDSGITFKRFAVPDPDDGDKMKVVALAWFSFNNFLTCSRWTLNEVEGFSIRSKNVAMGDKNSLGIHAINNVSSFTMSPRETLAAIAGFSGEFLFDTDLLEDDAKRDWFKPSPQLTYLMGSIASFLKSARKCRYSMSELLSEKKANSDSAKNRLRENLRELMEEDQFEEFFVEYAPKKSSPRKKSPKNDDKDKTGDDRSDDMMSMADYDIPNKSIQIKEFYNETMSVIEEMGEEKKIKRITFIEMRSRIRNHYRKDCDGNDGEHPPGGA